MTGRDGSAFLPGLDPLRTELTLWGTRGSIPTPGTRFVRHGGNTSCMAIRQGDEIFVFDAGSGIRELGLDLVGSPIRKVHLFITHTHWDHIQGFPFFAPAYAPGFSITIHAAEGFGKDIASLFRGQLDRDYFPVQIEDMQADISFRSMADGGVEIGPAKVTSEFTEHPGATVGYKIEIAGTRIAWVPDNEFLLGHTDDPRDLDRDHWLVKPCETFIRFMEGVDLAIHEAQYTNQEYLRRIRWGHSSISNAALLMKFAGVPRWLVTHHDPLHDDTALQNKLSLTRQILERLGHEARVDHAFDGMREYL